MQKTMITAATVLALVVSAGASMAGPLNGHSFGGKAHDLRASASQALNSADQMAHTGSRNADMVGLAETNQGVLQIYSVDTIADAVAMAQILAPNANGHTSKVESGSQENKHIPVEYE
ncbi:hypothetical protein AB838_07855 [Rhodobacteraceae bacterium (ex Bugula neritina AB1)]|nr:hypothetical protein AB838_07855 [Rhodobacteraceae bacterium (ex Bugula neritina AB1)]